MLSPQQHLFGLLQPPKGTAALSFCLFVQSQSMGVSINKSSKLGRKKFHDCRERGKGCLQQFFVISRHCHKGPDGRR